MLILASASPRRSELLQQAGYRFQTVPAHVEETAPPDLAPQELVQYLAEKKAQAVAQHFPQETILAADTVSALGNTVFGKPHTPKAAVTMLQQLSGQTHQVYTGFCVRQGNWMESQWVKTDVCFYPLTAEEISAYVATGEPLDKAGAYGIQGRGALLVREIHGDFYNVVGLPLAQVSRVLKQIGVCPQTT